VELVYKPSSVPSDAIFLALHAQNKKKRSEKIDTEKFQFEKYLQEYLTYLRIEKTAGL
jgi:hypothetical protein